MFDPAQFSQLVSSLVAALSNTASLSSLALGFSLGCIHAFDIDHVMAVSVMANSETNLNKCLRYSSRWALGHGAVLVVLGVLLFALGFKLPEGVAYAAEKMIGVLLILFGGLLIFQLARYQGLQNYFHHHEHTKTIATARGTPFSVGIIHGMAGNAPVLAMLPALAQSNIFAALAYLLLFSIGLLTSMTLFGFCFGHLQRWLRHHNEQLLDISAGVIGLSSVAVGAVWLGV